jgi:hypothetical protein
MVGGIQPEAPGPMTETGGPQNGHKVAIFRSLRKRLNSPLIAAALRLTDSR